jgi:hypothetical protein
MYDYPTQIVESVSEMSISIGQGIQVFSLSLRLSFRPSHSSICRWDRTSRRSTSKERTCPPLPQSPPSPLNIRHSPMRSEGLQRPPPPLSSPHRKAGTINSHVRFLRTRAHGRKSPRLACTRTARSRRVSFSHGGIPCLTLSTLR